MEKQISEIKLIPKGLKLIREGLVTQQGLCNSFFFRHVPLNGNPSQWDRALLKEPDPGYVPMACSFTAFRLYSVWPSTLAGKEVRGSEPTVDRESYD